MLPASALLFILLLHSFAPSGRTNRRHPHRSTKQVKYLYRFDYCVNPRLFLVVAVCEVYLLQTAGFSCCLKKFGIIDHSPIRLASYSKFSFLSRYFLTSPKFSHQDKLEIHLSHLFQRVQGKQVFCHPMKIVHLSPFVFSCIKLYPLFKFFDIQPR